MRTSYVALYALAQVAQVSAYGAIADVVAAGGFQKRQDGQYGKGTGLPDPDKTFNASLQYVSNTGIHAFKAPDFEAGDVRGPCPGLNILANHGYIPRNGVGGLFDFVSGTKDVFGMGEDLSLFLSVVGGIFDGDILSWSIGGPSKQGLNLDGLLGTPQGMSGSHNKYECDASPTRGDLYTHGNDFMLQMDQFKQLYEMGQANGDDYTLELMNNFRSSRFDHSVANNPYFFNGPFTGVLVQPAAYQFIYRFMGNKSAEHPQGKLNSEILMSFMSVTKDSKGEFVYTPGHERIPDNFYKRAIGDEYSAAFLNLDSLDAALKYPKFLTIGGNTGKVNTLTGVTPGDLTGGIFNATNLLEGNNLACFAMQAVQQLAPDLIKCGGILGNITAPLRSLGDALGGLLDGLTCPQLTELDQKQFAQFPGFSKMSCGNGTYDH